MTEKYLYNLEGSEFCKEYAEIIKEELDKKGLCASIEQDLQFPPAHYVFTGKPLPPDQEPINPSEVYFERNRGEVPKLSQVKNTEKIFYGLLRKQNTREKCDNRR